MAFCLQKVVSKKTSLNHSAACKRSCRNIGGVFFLKTLPNRSAGRDVHQGTMAPSDPLCVLPWVLMQFHNTHRMDVSGLTHTMSTQKLGCATPYNISLEASVGLTYSEMYGISFWRVCAPEFQETWTHRERVLSLLCRDLQNLARNVFNV